MARPRLKINEALIRQLYEDKNMSIRQISKETGYSRPTVHRRLREMGKLKVSSTREIV